MSELKTQPLDRQAERQLLRQIPIVIAMCMVLLLLCMGLLRASGNTLDRQRIEIVSPDFLININTDGIGELMLLPGVGKVIANRIIEHRNNQGLFTSINQLDDISGISQRTITKLSPFLMPLTDDQNDKKKRHDAQ